MKTVLLAALACALFAASASAQDAFEFYREEAQVFIASRRAEPTLRAPASVDVVTAEEIRAYGYTNLWEALRYRVGMDVIEARSSDGNRAVVSARGFSRDFVAEMQVLVDGRSVYSPFAGGVYWANIPVQLQDVERIEIVRGPNGALYGSNACLGVVNIITRRPGKAAAAEGRAHSGSRGDALGAFSVEAGTGAWGWRLSHESRIDDGNPSAAGDNEGNDFLHSNKLNFRGRWAPDAATDVELFGGGSWQTEGVPGFSRKPRADIEQDFQMVRAARDLDSAGSAEVLIARSDNHLVVDPNPLLRAYQYDAEALHRFVWWGERVKSSWGAGWRLSAVYSDQFFAGRPYQQNRLVRGFTHHAVSLAERLTLVAGLSLEDSQTGGFEPDWQAAALFSPAEDQVLRLSCAHAATIPPLFNTAANYRISAASRLVGNPDLTPQHFHSWEAGWAGKALDGALQSNLNVFFMEIHDRTFAARLADDPVGVRVISYDNGNRAQARGLEASQTYSFGPGRAVFANYTFERVSDEKGPTDVYRTDLRRGTPVHKANLGGRLRFERGFGLAAALGYKDAFDAQSTTRNARAAVPPAFRLDAKASWSPRPDLELFVSGENLLYAARVEYADGTAVARTLRGGAIMRFGL